jgi:uncharacterized surface protein with fasciclin (FAS1) repeats
MTFKHLMLAGALAASLPFAHAGDHGEKHSHHEEAQKDIVETAVAAGSFNTLAAALGAADLVDALKGDGPFTVFAPTDEAFAKLPAGTVESLLKPENKDQLINILTYHVVPAEVPAATALKLDEAEALNGDTIALTRRDGDLFLNDSKVIKTDITTANGIIHVIDTVLLPPEMTTAAADRETAPAMRLARMALDKGVPLYNHGNHAGCAAVYEMAARAMLELPHDGLNSQQRQALRDALRTVDHSYNNTRNAWTMRHALDAVMGMTM